MKQKILAFIKDEISFEPLEEIDLQEDLFGSGIIDSMGMMKLIDFIEKEAQIAIPENDLTVENFMTVEKIVSYLRKINVSDG